LSNYFYLSDGTKTRALKANGSGLVYRGPFVYRRGSDGSLTFESASFSGGRLTSSGALLYVTDYLGSVRAVVNGSNGAIYKASDYSTFGSESKVESIQTASFSPVITLRDSYTGKEAQTPDFTTGYTDFGARQYSPTLRRWMTPDPLSEKYYGISPYAFCNNNPVNLVDPDGRVWVNKQKQIVCDANGPTVHATPEEVELIKAMNSIKTGRQQLQKLIEAPFDVIVDIYHYAPPPDLPYGDYSFYGVKYDQDAGRYVPKYSGSWITIYVQRAKERSEELGISLSEAIAVNFGHEIEHTTSENLELAYQNALKKEREYIPKQISKDMITEFVYLMTLKSLKDIQILPDPLIQTKLNIDIKVKE
jgi:RHS repeat-associated protein